MVSGVREYSACGRKWERGRGGGYTIALKVRKTTKKKYVMPVLHASSHSPPTPPPTPTFLSFPQSHLTVTHQPLTRELEIDFHTRFAFRLSPCPFGVVGVGWRGGGDWAESVLHLNTSIQESRGCVTGCPGGSALMYTSIQE